MPAYASSIRRPPRTLTELEQARILKVTGEHRAGFRDHVLLSLALGTALREHEIAALDLSDVLNEDGRVRRRIILRVFKRSTDEPAIQEIFLPDRVWHKLTKFVAWKRAEGESLAPDAPLFLSRRKQRIALRTIRHLFHRWQARAGFDQRFKFHALRHSCLSGVYRATGDIRLTQRVARHKSVETTTIYAIPSDDDVFAAVRALSC